MRGALNRGHLKIPMKEGPGKQIQYGVGRAAEEDPFCAGSR